MRIISQSQNQLILRHVPWLPLIFAVVFLLAGIAFALSVITGPSTDYFGVLITLGLPLGLLTYLCNITTTTFDKAANKVTIQHWRLIGAEPAIELPLSAVSDISISDPHGRMTSGMPIAAQIVLVAGGQTYGLSKERSQFFRSKNNHQTVESIRDFVGLSAKM